VGSVGRRGYLDFVVFVAATVDAAAAVVVATAMVFIRKSQNYSYQSGGDFDMNKSAAGRVPAGPGPGPAGTRKPQDYSYQPGGDFDMNKSPVFGDDLDARHEPLGTDRSLCSSLYYRAAHRKLEYLS